ncbi:MAG: STAS domain-containing protein [Actinobacteria bacterium]|nr:STAS domain-containing protein [Actinomycetota bacterium]
MGREPSSLPGGGLVVRRQELDSRVVLTLTGSLELEAVEELAACADQICRSTIRAAVFDVAAVTVVDDAGARTLAAACGCLAAHGVEAEVRGIGGQFRAVLDRLDLTLPELQAGAVLDR